MAKDSPKARAATADAPEEQGRTIVYLGNRAGIEVLPDPNSDDGTTIRTPIQDGPTKRCTKVVIARGATLMEAAVHITDPARGVWQAHSDDPAPAWVSAEGPNAAALAQLLAAHYGGIEVRDPEPDNAVTGEQEG
jgi:hypothetical protein